MLPKKATFKHLDILQFLNIDTHDFLEDIEKVYIKKRHYFYVSLTFILPLAIVLASFAVYKFNQPWWSFIIFFIFVSIMSFFIVSNPIYQAFIKTCEEEENLIRESIDQKLTTLAINNYFTKEAKAQRLLNQEFDVISLTTVSGSDLTSIEDNKALSVAQAPILNLEKQKADGTCFCFYEHRTLSPVILAKINLYDPKTNKFNKQIRIPIEFELVRGLVSEQIIYFKQESYIINPKLLVDVDHFQELYHSDRKDF